MLVKQRFKSLGRGVRSIMKALVVIFIVFNLTGCSMLLIEATVNRVEVQDGVTDRDNIIIELGEPDSTKKSNSGNTCDQYKLGKLTQTPEGTYYYPWNQYPPFIIITLGLIELIVLPITTVDIMIKTFQRDYLSLEYDEDKILIAYTREENEFPSCN